MMTENQKSAEEKPELLYADLQEGRAFRALVYPITKELVADFMDTVGDGNPLYAGDAQLAPPGLVAIYARASYLQDHAMPSGGILAKQEFEFHNAARIGDTLTVRAAVVERYVDKKERKRVDFLIRAETQDGQQVSTTRLYAIWPK
jgi:acyl dehydratase